MANLVNSSKLETENLRESHWVLRDAQWVSDDKSPDCAACKLVFNVSNRRVSLFIFFLNSHFYQVYLLFLF